MCEVRRVLHNVNSNTSAPLPSTKKSVIRFCENSSEGNGVSTNGEESSKEKKSLKSDQNDFSEPKLLTSLKIIESIKNIGNEHKTKKPPKNSAQTDSKQKASRKVNIPFEEKIYKGLIELQVTDEDLGLHNYAHPKPKDFTKNREPEPVLSDFHKPKFDKEYIVKPAIPKFEINPVLVTEIPSVLAATKRWEPEES